MIYKQTEEIRACNAIAQTKSLEKDIRSKDRQHQLDMRAIGQEYRMAMAANDRVHKVEKNNLVTSITTLTKDLKVSLYAYSMYIQ